MNWNRTPVLNPIASQHIFGIFWAAFCAYTIRKAWYVFNSNNTSLHTHTHARSHKEELFKYANFHKCENSWKRKGWKNVNERSWIICVFGFARKFSNKSIENETTTPTRSTVAVFIIIVIVIIIRFFSLILHWYIWCFSPHCHPIFHRSPHLHTCTPTCSIHSTSVLESVFRR